MKILFPYMARWNSANMSRYYHLFTKVAEIGHCVIVLQPPSRKSEETNYIDFPMQNHPNITVHTVAIPYALWEIRFPIDKFVKKAVYTFWSILEIRRVIRKEVPDVIVIYNLPQYLYTIGISIPVIFDYADDYLAMFRHELGISERHVLSNIAMSLLEKLIDKSALVTSVSEFLNAKIRHKNKLLLSNGADTIPREAIPPALHIDKSKPVIGYVGAFEYFIDLDCMIEVARALPSCTFLLVGAGREFKRIQQKVADAGMKNIILTGAVPHRQAMQFIKEMDVCLNLFVKSDVSHAASPIKIFEYIAAGKPVVTTRLHEIQRLDGEGEIVFYADTAAEVIDAINSIISDSDTTASHVAHGKKFIASGYTWEAIADQFVSAAQKILPHRE
jgi:glycosyltransferase involved in cell wall biosynthesis